MTNTCKQSIKVLDFFSGCGGTSLGLKYAGLDIVLALDNNVEAIETFEKNIKPEEKSITDDICDVTVDTIENIVKKYRENNYILFCGCAPCQPFSTQNKKRFDPNDNRINLLKKFSDFVSYSLPDFILCENVPGLQRIEENGPLPNFIRKLKELGYYVPDPRIVKAEKYGVPQRRKRLVILASKLGPIEYPDETHDEAKLPYKTVRDAIGNSKLPQIKAGEEHPNIKKYPNHRSAGLNKLNLDRLMCISEGQGRNDWPEELVLECHKKHKGHSDVYGRLEWDKPSVTLTTKCTNISNGRFGHPTQHRALSVREAALIQTFPMDFIFCGSSLTSMSKQVGNAVPVKLAEAFGKQFINHVKEYNKEHYNGKI